MNGMDEMMKSRKKPTGRMRRGKRGSGHPKKSMKEMARQQFYGKKGY